MAYPDLPQGDGTFDCRMNQKHPKLIGPIALQVFPVILNTHTDLPNLMTHCVSSKS